MRVLVTGASGFIGARLGAELVRAGHDVRAMTRNPERYAATGTPVFGDVSDPDSLRAALDGVEAAYYLVHSLDAVDFVRRDAEAALAFGRAARGAGLRRVVYLGGLGNDADQLSAHLRSRREVERLLTATGVPVTVLRAGIVLGAGGLSFELMRQLVVRLPVMVTPRWVKTRSQPIAVTDVVAYLVGVLTADEAAGQTYEVGGPEVLPYREMLVRVARSVHRRLYVWPVPLLTPSAVLGHARGGSMVLVLAVAALNVAAEEVYFRGVLYQTVARTNPVLVTTTVYALVTAGTINVALVLAAVVMGFIFARQRRVAGGLLAPVVPIWPGRCSWCCW